MMKFFEFIIQNKAILIVFIQLDIFIVSNATTELEHQITVLISQNEPFVVFENRTESDGQRGIDISILDSFATKFGLKIEYIRTNESMRAGFASEDKIKKFYKTNIDILSGGLEDNFVTNKYLMVSEFYHYDYITWCVSKSKALSLRTRLVNARRDPWMFVIFFIQTICLLLVGYFLQLLERPQLCWNQILFTGLAFFIGYPAPWYNPQHNGHRFAFGVVLLGAIVFTTSFLAFFMDFASGKFYAHQVRSIPEIISSEFILAGDQYTFMKLLQRNQTYPLNMLEKFRFCSDINICLDELKWNQKLAVAISHERIQSSSLLMSSQLYCFSNMESVYGFYLRFLVKKNFRYSNQLNEFIQIATSSGIISHWTNSNRMKPYFIRVEEDNTREENIIIGMGLIFVSLYIFSIFIFFVEQITYRKARNARARRFWIIIEMYIDPDRHFLLHDMRR